MFSQGWKFSVWTMSVKPSKSKTKWRCCHQWFVTTRTWITIMVQNNSSFLNSKDGRKEEQDWVGKTKPSFGNWKNANLKPNAEFRVSQRFTFEEEVVLKRKWIKAKSSIHQKEYQTQIPLIEAKLKKLLAAKTWDCFSKEILTCCDLRIQLNVVWIDCVTWI